VDEQHELGQWAALLEIRTRRWQRKSRHDGGGDQARGGLLWGW